MGQIMESGLLHIEISDQHCLINQSCYGEIPLPETHLHLFTFHQCIENQYILGIVGNDEDVSPSFLHACHPCIQIMKDHLNGACIILFNKTLRYQGN